MKATINETLGLTNFLFDSVHFPQVSQFHLQRYFVDNFRVIKDASMDFWTQPTFQNFKHDDVLANAKANGVKNIWCTQGKLPHHTTQGKANKVNPIRDSDDPLLQSSWADYGRLVKQIALRYADDSQEHLSEVQVFSGNTYQKNTPKAGLGLVDAMEDRNEWDFKMGWSGALYTMTPEQSAVGFKVFYENVRSVSATMKVIMGGTINPEVATFEKFITKLKSLFEAEGKTMPTDWHLCFHWYMRNGSNNQGAGTWGVSPETAHAYEFGLQMDGLCVKYGLLGWYCTETGWSTYTGSNIDLGKQNAPKLEGYDIYQSQGICFVRLALTWAATEYCKGISFWNRLDNDDVGAYQHGGVNFPDWTPKKSQGIISEYLTPYRNHSVGNYRTNGTLFGVDLTDASGTVTLVWTDINKSGEYDAKPKIGTLTGTPPVEPPQPTMRKLFLSTSTIANYEPLMEIKEGDNYLPTKLAFYVDGAGPVTLEMLKDGAVFHASRVENGAPLAFGGDDGGKLRLKDCPAGSYTAKINGQPDIHFTVGTVTTPQNEPVTETYIESGSVVVFKTATGTYKTSVTKV